MESAKRAIVLLITLLAFNSIHTAKAGQITIDCQTITEVLKNYKSNMTDTNAKNLIKEISLGHHITCKNGATEVLEEFLGIMPALSNKLNRENETSFDLAIVWLYRISDGFYAEEIEIMLGSFITEHTEFFLKSMKRNEPLLYLYDGQIFRGILLNTGIYEKKAECIEIMKRKQSLEANHDPMVSGIRDTSVKIISEEIQEYCR